MSETSGKVISIKKVKQRRAEQKTLCSAGFHKWQAATETKFDVKQGKLVTLERCGRCGEERVKLR